MDEQIRVKIYQGIHIKIDMYISIVEASKLIEPTDYRPTDSIYRLAKSTIDHFGARIDSWYFDGDSNEYTFKCNW